MMLLMFMHHKYTMFIVIIYVIVSRCINMFPYVICLVYFGSFKNIKYDNFACYDLFYNLNDALNDYM
jgi:hypothetical protein